MSSTSRRSLFVLMVAGLWACATPSADLQPKPGSRAVTAAQIFEEMKEQMRKGREAWQQEYAKLPEYLKRGRVNNQFDMLDVKEEDWFATEEGRFAHSIKIPNPVPQDSGYRDGMTQQEYFEHLCKTEAGEFIYRTVDNVEGVFQIRPRKNVYTTAELRHLYAMEDPYGHYTEENEHVGFEMVEPLKYSFFEIPVSGLRQYPLDLKPFFDPSVHVVPPPGLVIARFRYTGDEKFSRSAIKLEYDTKSTARYGYTWRGIKRPHDREMGIAGGELIVLDLRTNEVMGVRRGYVIWNRAWTFRACPRYGYFGGEDKGTNFTAWFVAKVVRPPRWKEYFRLLETMRKLPPGVNRFIE